ncbi:hypothetical protein [Streptomyces sp. NBC_00019]|uniref:hypothetical protein n=1 Tax=Streptomyces sp. NBC_00019 TaxID=2975623 RepID=UPI00324FB2D9
MSYAGDDRCDNLDAELDVLSIDVSRHLMEHHHRLLRELGATDAAHLRGLIPVAGRPGRPRRRPEALLGEKGYDCTPNREQLRKCRILSGISRKGAPNIQGLGKLRWVRVLSRDS